MRIRNGTALMVAAACWAGAAMPAEAAGKSLFEQISGTWSGSGAVRLSGGGQEPLRCRADYRASGPDRLALSLRCASDSFNLQVRSDIARQGNELSGTWTESTFNVSGSLSGRVAGDRIDGVVDGGGFSVHLTVQTRGNNQNVTLVSEGAASGSASVALRRN